MKKTLTCLAVLLIAVTAMAFNTITFVFKDGTQKSYADSGVDSIGMGDPSTPAKDSVYVYLKNKTKEAANINDLDSIRFNFIEDDSCLTVSAEESSLEFRYNEDSMTAEVWRLTDREIETVIIPCKVEKDGKIYEVTSIEGGFLAENGYITHIEIPASVTYIGDNAFSWNINLKNINVSSENKNYTSINGVIYNKDTTTLIKCPSNSSMTSIEIPASVTNIGDLAFYNCSNLTSIIIPDSVTNIGEDAFEHCTSLISINASSENKNYTSVDGVLYNKDITELIAYPAKISQTSFMIPEGITSIMTWAFEDCKNLTSIEIPNSVTNIGDYAFYNCSSLTSIIIPDSVTYIGLSAFSGCSSLTNIEISKNVKTIRLWTFEDCSSLTSIVIPASVTSIEYYAFIGCDSLKTAEVPKGLSLYYANFPNTTKIIRYEVDVIPLYTYNEENMTAEVIGCKYGSIETASIPSKVEKDGKVYDVTSIGNKAFKDYDKLTSIEIPESVTNIGDSAFYNCNKLTSIVIPDSVTNIGKYAFMGCSKLTNIEIPASVTSIGEPAFESCSSLISINVSSENKNYTSVDGVLFNKDITELIACPAKISQTSFMIPETVTNIEENTFAWCENLTSIEIPKSVTSIGKDAFKRCDNLKTTKVPEGLDISNATFPLTTEIIRY